MNWMMSVTTRMGRKIAVPMALEMRPIEMLMEDCSRPSLLPSKGSLLHLAGSRKNLLP